MRGHTGTAMVAENDHGEDITVEKVAADPGRYPASITVMYRREKGHDPEDRNRFRVGYGPDGSPVTNPKGMKPAVRVARGASKGCLGCHGQRPGGHCTCRPVRFA